MNQPKWDRQHGQDLYCCDLLCRLECTVRWDGSRFRQVRSHELSARNERVSFEASGLPSRRCRLPQLTSTKATDWRRSTTLLRFRPSLDSRREVRAINTSALWWLILMRKNSWRKLYEVKLAGLWGEQWSSVGHSLTCDVITIDLSKFERTTIACRVRLVILWRRITQRIENAWPFDYLRQFCFNACLTNRRSKGCQDLSLEPPRTMPPSTRVIG